MAMAIAINKDIHPQAPREPPQPASPIKSHVGPSRSGSVSSPACSPRAVVAGIAIGTLLAFTNTYFGLQTGWISMMSLQSSILGYALFKLLPSSHRNPLSVAENVLLQTTSTAVGSMPLTTGLIGIIPALAQLNSKTDGSPPIIFSPLALVAWCLAIAFFGVFLAIPLREQVILKEKLVFPSGTATAQILSLLHQKPILTPTPSSSQSEYASAAQFQPKQWRLLVASFLVSIVFSLCSLAFPVLYAMPIFDVFGPLAHDWSWWFTPSFAFVGQGMIMGFHTAYSMMCGMLCGWLFLSPLAVHQGWATSETAKGWILWPALSIMIVESVLSLSSVVLSMLLPPSTTPQYSRMPTDEDEEGESEGHLPAADTQGSISLRITVGGFLVSCILCVIIMGALFEGMKWWATVVALGLASIFSLLGVRALGETDLNPVSAISKISQLIFGLIQPQNLVANLVAGGISEAGAMQSGELMQDFKTAQLHGVEPGSMFHGQMIGSIVSVFVSSGVYWLYSKAYTLPSTTFPVPTAAVWLSLARLVNRGELPEGSKRAMEIFGIIFFVVGVMRMSSSKMSQQGVHRRRFGRISRLLPSGIAFSVGMINTPSFSIARFVGGLLTEHVHRQGGDKISLIVIASGFVLGEGCGSIGGLVIKSLGVPPWSCWGCGAGGGGYCGGC